MDEKKLKDRTKQFALNIMKLVDKLPNSIAGRTLGNQLVRSGTSVGANYRAACRGRSKAEFTSKIGIVAEEADESAYWLELIMDGKLLGRDLIEPLLKEANELAAIFIASAKTAGQSQIKNHQSKIKNA
ncbi:MAG: four helix bundle protein [Deltaproteobacteria bacterium]|nr:four helix bundle protein [Deltaproteobacteria bacterium]MBM4322664.1 four helix bundle protein [Deltaproteobacteria bacterium]